MDITDKRIDGGKPFDWGRTSADYARYRDIYPDEFYDAVKSRGLCTDGQRVLDAGTGTGVLPRNMYRFGAKWTGCDISENQIEQAKRIAEDTGMNIDFLVSEAEEVSFPDETFDRIEKMSKSEETSPTAWSELVIPTNFSIKRQGEEEYSEGNKISYQIFSDGIVEFKVYKNNKSTLNIVSATDGTLSVMRKNSKFNEYAVVGEIPLDLCSLILSKITENR